jgi:HIV-1 Vpr-binding protein
MEAAMEDQANQAQDEAQPPPPPQPPSSESQPQSQSQGDEDEEEEPRNEDDELIAKAQKLMEKITSSPENPSSFVLHALASLLETQESRYMEENGHSPNNGRAAHNIGRLGNVVRENDDFFELISSTFLSETRYPRSVQAAAARLLLSCSLTWIYPHVFEEAVLENIKNWVIDDAARFSGVDHNCKSKEALDYEMVKTYSTGLLAVCLAGGSPVVEDVLTSGLSAKLMRYLRVRVLGETNTSQKDANHLIESKNASGATCIRGRDESRGRVRQVLDITYLDDLRGAEERSVDDQCVERDQDGSIVRHGRGEEFWVNDGEPPNALDDGVDIYEADADGDDRWHSRDLRDGKNKFGDFDENARDESSRRKANRGSRSRCKGRVNEGGLENEQLLTSPGSGSRLGQGRSTIRSFSRHLDTKKVPDARKSFGRIASDTLPVEREDNDDCFQECRIGTKDISDLVKKAVRSAEAEARAANAPEEAIKAAGDAAAEVVKSAAFEEFKTTNNEEAAVLAASRAASTVIDAANVIEVSR